MLESPDSSSNINLSLSSDISSSTKSKSRDIESNILFDKNKSISSHSYNEHSSSLKESDILVFPSRNQFTEYSVYLMKKNKTFQVLCFLFFAWIIITLFEFISALILADSDIISDGFFNTFKTISFLITCLSILFNHIYKSNDSFINERIELIASLSSIIFLVIVSVYMLLQALHLLTDDDIRIPPANYLQWLYVIKVIVDMLALLSFSDYIIHPSIQVKLQLWKTNKVWKKLYDISFEEIKEIRKLLKNWDNHSENMNALCASLISDLISSLFFVLFFYCGGRDHYGQGYMVISIINFFLVIVLVKPLFKSILQIFMQGKCMIYEAFYKKVLNECTYFNGSLGIKKMKFWSKAQNYIEGYIKIYCNQNIERSKLKDKIFDIAKEIELHIDLTIEFIE